MRICRFALSLSVSLILYFRGTDLISPEDLLRAAMLMGPLALPMRLRDFASGVRVLESVTRSDERSVKAVAALVAHAATEQQQQQQQSDDSNSAGRARTSSGGGLDASSVAERLGIALALALEQLLLAEDAGLVCRDDSVEGLFFFAPPPAWAAAAAAGPAVK